MSRTDSGWIAPPKLPHTHFVDNAIYTDEGLFAEEQQKIFSKVWKFVCHEQEVANEGDFRTTTVAGHPILIVRGEDGVIRSFLNACSHRGAMVVTAPSGNARRFTCAFHRWVYDTDGRCMAIPRPDAYTPQGVKAEDLGLREIRTEIRLGLVFVNLDEQASSLDDFLGTSLDPLKEVLGTVTLEPFHFHRVVLDTNWKLWQLTNAELYHELLHYYNRITNVSQAAFFEREINCLPNGHVTIGSFKPNYTAVADTAGGENRHKTLPGFEPNEWRIVNLFPDVMVNARTTCVRIDTEIPISATKTIVEYRGLGIKGESAEDRAMRIRHHNDVWGPFGRNVPEDNLVTEMQMTAMRHGTIPFSIHAREEGGRGQDDNSLRAYFAEWGHLMGRDPADPFNKRSNG